MKTKPYKHQAKEYFAHRNSPYRAMLWQMRSGKTKVCIDEACWLHSIMEVDAVLIFAPNGVHDNWIRRELPVHHWDELPRDELTWVSSKVKSRAFQEQMGQLMEDNGRLKWLAVNSETLMSDGVTKLLKRYIQKYGTRMMFIADECHDFRRPGAKRTGRARAITKRVPYRRVLTGTSVLNSPLHAFSQFELLKKSALGFDRFKDFKSQYAIISEGYTHAGGKRVTYEVIDGYQNVEELRARMAEYSSVVLREDCDDMPNLIVIPKTVPLSIKQQKAYNSLVNDHYLELKDSDEFIDAELGGVRIQKQQQILGGFIINEDREVISIDDNPPRLDIMVDEVEGTEGKIIIWCKFQEDIRRVTARLKKEGIKYVEYHGKVSATKRTDAIDSFMEDESIVAFVGQPKAGGVGLNLSAAKAVLWYSPDWDCIDFSQANERATLIGGEDIPNIQLQVPGTVDETIYTNLADKIELADYVSGSGLRDYLLETLKKV